MKGEWIEVNGSKELPMGKWLVQIKDERTGAIKHHVADALNLNLIVIGSHFDFDMDPVIRYYNVDVRSI